MSAKSSSEQFSNLQYIIEFVPKLVHFILICLLFVYNSLLRVFFFSAHFSSHHCRGSSIWLWLHQSVPEPQGCGNDEDEEGLKVNKVRGALQLLCQCPSQPCSSAPQPWLCWNYGSGSTSNLLPYSPGKKKGASLMASGIHPPGVNLIFQCGFYN